MRTLKEVVHDMTPGIALVLVRGKEGFMAEFRITNIHDLQEPYDEPEKAVDEAVRRFGRERVFDCQKLVDEAIENALANGYTEILAQDEGDFAVDMLDHCAALADMELETLSVVDMIKDWKKRRAQQARPPVADMFLAPKTEDQPTTMRPSALLTRTRSG